MDEGQLLALKGAIEKRFMFEIIKLAKNIDVAEWPYVSFTLEFHFDDHGLLSDSNLSYEASRPLLGSGRVVV